MLVHPPAPYGSAFNFLASLINGNAGKTGGGGVGEVAFNFLASLINGNLLK